ncbi:hypothetical protein DFH94DRAFT_634682 [Russula ochroleuca]|uniref:Uncharacterized protein n=1 Tax=Russula ochroleuca TaxID=152965 RepID=A0A9P5MS67_9AGAM|nr:hypothetical protein DFH94DRAFT_634682 [Russula ochroleuca]
MRLGDTYDEVASHVGLEPLKRFKDAGTFEIHRSRIPTNLFKSIVQDMDIMLAQYGSPEEQMTKEARSRFFSPIFNCLVAQFTFALRNDPETSIKGHYPTQGGIEYLFKTYGAVAVLFIKMKHSMKSNEECLKAIAQIIAECSVFDLNNCHDNVSSPIHCILSDGSVFEFFKYERMPKPTFLCGCFHGDPTHLKHGLHLPDFTMMETCLPFIVQLCWICKTIFDVMLSTHIAGLKAYRCNQLEKEGKKEGLMKRSSIDGWDQAILSGKHAQAMFQQAEGQHKEGNVDAADATVDQGLLALKESTGAVLTNYKSEYIMTGWDDNEVGKK